MHRYVALIANTESQDSFDRLTSRLARRFINWRCALDGRWAKAWVTASIQSPIGFISHGSSGCLIGVQLGDRQPAPWDGDAGSGLLSRSWGAYISIQVGEGQDITITRDPGGQIPCWTSHLSGADVYFSHLDDVPEVETTSTDPIDWDYIQYSLNVGSAHGRQTGVKSVAELLPGRQVRYSGGSWNESSAWPIADIIASPFKSYAEAEAALRAATAEAVGGWARRYDRIALSLSGGFDSAVVLGLIREQAPHARVLGINYLIAHPEGDERAYANAAADQHSVPLRVEPLSAEGRRFDVGRARNWLRPTPKALPLGGAEARARAACAISAQAVFSGAGGDQVFGQDLPLSVLAEAVKDRLPLPILLNIAHDYAKMSSDTFWNIGWATINELLGSARALTALLQIPNPYLTREAIEGANFERFCHPDLLEIGKRLSSAKLHQVVRLHNLNDHCARYRQEYIIEEINPLCSQLVIEASLRVPPYWMNPAGRRRGLARRAFRDLVPDTILMRRGKGSTTSHTLQILANNMPFLRELMLDGYLVSRGILDMNKLATALTPQTFFTNIKLPGLIPSIITELWIQSYLCSFSSSTKNKRLEPSS